jgi:site-specific DNA-methyltransferase (adenine-specific)
MKTTDKKCLKCDKPIEGPNNSCNDCMLNEICDVEDKGILAKWNNPSIPFVISHSIVGLDGDKFSPEERKEINETAEKISDSLINNIKKQLNNIKGKCKKCGKNTEDVDATFCNDCAMDELGVCKKTYGSMLPKFELNKTYFGDCLDLMNIIPDKSIDMILADLPYEKTSRNDWDKRIDLNKLWQHYKRIIKDNGNIVLTAIQPFTAELVVSNIDMFKYSLVWEKTTATQFLNAKKRFLQSHEDILVFSPGKLGKIVYNPQKTTGHARKVSSAHHKRNSKKSTDYGDYELSSYDSTERYPKSVLKFATDKQKSALHSTHTKTFIII